MRQSRPLCKTDQTVAEKRHPFCYEATGRHQWTGETVETGCEPCHQSSHHHLVPTKHHRFGRFDPHPRASESHTWQESHQEAATGEPLCIQVGFCRVAWLYCLQSHLEWKYGSQSRCLPHQSGMSHMWVCFA